MTEFDSALLSVSTFLTRLGSVLVIAGCCLEAAELTIAWTRRRAFRKWIEDIFGKSRRRKIVFLVKFIKPRVLKFETLGFVILFIGLGIELLGSFETERIQSKENDRLTKQLDATTKQAGIAEKEAGDAMIFAAQIGTTNAQLVVLQSAAFPRVITVADQARAVANLRKFGMTHEPGASFVIISAEGDADDPKQLAEQIRWVLIAAHWTELPTIPVRVWRIPNGVTIEIGQFPMSKSWLMLNEAGQALQQELQRSKIAVTMRRGAPSIEDSFAFTRQSGVVYILVGFRQQPARRGFPFRGIEELPIRQ
jgi:hypothetical protein